MEPFSFLRFLNVSEKEGIKIDFSREGMMDEFAVMLVSSLACLLFLLLVSMYFWKRRRQAVQPSPKTSPRLH